MSAYITYNGIPNGSSLILGAGQYTFGSAPAAQAVTIDIPTDYDLSESADLVMNEGVIQVNGFGDPIGAHRGINKQAGRSPNFTAIAHKTYFGMLPDVRIPLTAVKNFTIRMVNDVEGAEYTVIAAGDTIKANADGTFTGTYGTYMVKAVKKGYRCWRGTFIIDEGYEGEYVCNISMTAAGENGWDGSTTSEPELSDGVYLIDNGEEMAWFANQVNGGNYNISGALTSDIDLCGYDWTPIGGSKSATAFQGNFDGQGHTVSGLYINNSTSTYQGLFGYIKTSNISGITVEGEVSGKQYVAGIVAYLGVSSSIDRCANHADVTGKSTYVGGITGSVSQATAKLTNCYNTGSISGTTNCGGVAGYNNANAVIENVFNLGEISGTKVASCIGGTTKKNNAKNMFAIKEYDIVEGQTTVTEEQMASGEIAYLLGEAFGQEIGKDTHPVIGGLKVLYNETENRYYNEENVPDGINSITTQTSDIWYNMHGIRIAAPCKTGIYIKNGKKVFVRF
jgi:hypothetical protein